MNLILTILSSVMTGVNIYYGNAGFAAFWSAATVINFASYMVELEAKTEDTVVKVEIVQDKD